VATATAESRATAIVAATQTSQIVATATAQRVAVADAAATATAHWQATATSQAVATVQARTTFVAEQQRTATAQRIATQSAGATQTAQAAGTATAEARIPPTMEPVPKINVFVLACDTGTDVRRGEVTNAWVTVQNVGNAEATNVEMTLSANDEAGEHPEKRQSVSYLPPDYQVTFKLSVDTRIGPESYVDVIVSAPGGITESDSKSTCATLDENAKRLIELAGEIGKSIPIPPFSFFRR
jgi:hypothetical protein